VRARRIRQLVLERMDAREVRHLLLLSALAQRILLQLVHLPHLYDVATCCAVLQPAVPGCNVSPLSRSASCRSLVTLLAARATPSAELPIQTSPTEGPPSVRQRWRRRREH
jgi:hypothetical protein